MDRVETLGLAHRLVNALRQLLPAAPGPELVERVNRLRRAQVSLDHKIERAYGSLRENSELVDDLKLALEERIRQVEALRREHEQFASTTAREEQAVEELVQRIQVSIVSSRLRRALPWALLPALLGLGLGYLLWHGDSGESMEALLAPPDSPGSHQSNIQPVPVEPAPALLAAIPVAAQPIHQPPVNPPSAMTVTPVSTRLDSPVPPGMDEAVPEVAESGVVTATATQAYGISGVKGLRMRGGPDAQAQVLDMLGQDERVEILQVGQGWVKVRRSNGGEGWVADRFLLASD